MVSNLCLSSESVAALERDLFRLVSDTCHIPKDNVQDQTTVSDLGHFYLQSECSYCMSINLKEHINY